MQEEWGPKGWSNHFYQAEGGGGGGAGGCGCRGLTRGNDMKSRF